MIPAAILRFIVEVVQEAPAFIGDDEPAATGHAVDIAPGIDFRDKAEALEGLQVRRVGGDLIEGGVAAKGRFLIGQQMDGREIRMRHGNNPFHGDYSTDAPRGAREAKGGSRMNIYVKCAIISAVSALLSAIIVNIIFRV